MGNFANSLQFSYLYLVGEKSIIFIYKLYHKIFEHYISTQSRHLNFISMHQDICNHLSLSKTRFEQINVNLGEREREKIERRNAGTSKERK